MIKLGTIAKDIITGFEGIVTARVEYLTGCTQYGLQPKCVPDGKYPEAQYFDESRLDGRTVEQIAAKTEAASNDKGGPHTDAPRRQY